MKIALFNKNVQNTNYFYHEKKAFIWHNVKQNRQTFLNENCNFQTSEQEQK